MSIVVLQLVVEVEDDGGLTGTHSLSVTINRNLFPPEMTFTTLSDTILENAVIGSTLSPSVAATDQDTSVSLVHKFIITFVQVKVCYTLL